jgi:hypothetical protein
MIFQYKEFVVCAAANGEPHNPKDHCLVGSTVEVSADELVLEVAPYAGEQYCAIQEKWE